MSWIAGIDLSTHFVDIVLVDEGDEQPPVWHRYPLRGQDAFDRARVVRHAMLSKGIAWVTETVAVGIEDPAGHHGVRSLARVQGGILNTLPRDLLVHPLAPAQWRRTAGLPGNATKQAVAAWAMRQHPPIRWDPPIPFDATDAYAIAVATRNLLDAA